MSTTTILKSLANDVQGGQVNVGQLTRVILEEVAISAQLVRLATQGDVLTMVFATPPSAGELITLNTLLNNYQYVAAPQGAIQHRYNATSAPGASNDSAEGFGVGSQWTYQQQIWQCRDATAGAAQWEIDVAHSAVSVQAGQGLAGGGTLAATRTLSLDLPSLQLESAPAATADALLMYSDADSAHRRVLIEDLPLVSAQIGDFSAAADARIAAQKAAANGLATLDANGRIPSAQLTTTIIRHAGLWNASTNTPALASGSGTSGESYYVSVAGGTVLDGVSGWQVKDRAVFNGTFWEKIDNTDSVTSVNGMEGAVTVGTDQVAEGSTNLYYTSARVTAHAAVAAATAHIADSSLHFPIQDTGSVSTGHVWSALKVASMLQQAQENVEVPSLQVLANDSVTETSSTMQLMPDMAHLTPAAGEWLVTLHAQVRSTMSTGLVSVDISGVSNTAVSVQGSHWQIISTTGRVTLDGSTNVGARWRNVSSGAAEAQWRSLSIQRVLPPTVV
jgi:hypothetical protein